MDSKNKRDREKWSNRKYNRDDVIGWIGAMKFTLYEAQGIELLGSGFFPGPPVVEIRRQSSSKRYTLFNTFFQAYLGQRRKPEIVGFAKHPSNGESRQIDDHASLQTRSGWQCVK